jgi:hypothetical protein
MVSGSIIKSSSSGSVDTYSPHNIESPRATNDLKSPKSSPRIKAVENVISSVTNMRREISISMLNRERATSSENIVANQNEGTTGETKEGTSVEITFKDVNKYKSINREEIIDVAIKLIKEYLDDKDSGKLLLAIDEYISHLPTDNIPHFINYRPNFDCLLNIEIAYRLNFTSHWTTLPGSYLYLHEWKYLIDQGILLLNSPISDQRLCLGQSSVLRYIDLLMETEEKVENGQIPTNTSLTHYTEFEILDNLATSYDVAHKGELKSYLSRVVPNAKNLKGMVAKTLVSWYYTFVFESPK